jgi:hypothetical protein
MRARRRSPRVAELPPRMPPARMRPGRGRDALSLLVEYPQPELLAMALSNLDACSLLALELVSKTVGNSLHGAALDGVWAAHMPVQIEQHLGRPFNCLGMDNVNDLVANNLCARGRYLRSRAATARLRDVIDHAKTRYKIKTERNGAVETVAHPSHVPPPLASFWRDATDAMLRGADVELRDNAGQTTLHWAVTLCDVKMVRELCKAYKKAGLQIDVRAKPLGPTRDGHRPVDIAIPSSHIESVLNEYRVLELEGEYHW